MKAFAILLLLLVALPVRAADISGTWQTDKSRYVMTIAKTKTGWRGEWFNLGEMDGSLNGNPLNVAVSGNTVTLAPLRTPGTFTGTISAGGTTISGDWGTHDPTPLVFERATARAAHPVDPASHKIQFVAVAPGVRLEVLDFGGQGPALIFLAGLGNTGHVFDSFAPRFTAKHHVYAITRRGYGVSDWPPPTEANYDPDRLGDDVLAVMAALHIDRPVLAGHSIAGEELSSIGTRHPEKVAGLIYLDAAHPYAFYDPKVPYAGYVTRAVVRRDLDRLATASPSEAHQLAEEIKQSLPYLEASLDRIQPPPNRPLTSRDLQRMTIDNTARAYRHVDAPVLVLSAVPQKCAPDCDTPSAKDYAAGLARQADAVAALNPGAHVVRLEYADHYVWRSNPEQVEREMNEFLDRLAR
ncbi:MAG TPA: alpha/beta hydrolase [Rhizomicrobium sp.]|nr:alpha/beta hydrolase [Rhizomicrobium sp.]